MKKLFTTNNLLLTGILILAGFLRFWRITQFPAGFNADEAAIGYNAWSVLKTGKDEFGDFLPITFTSFGDFKPPLYFYLDLPFILIFGLNELAVRLPNALAGVGTVFLVFLIVKKISKNYSLAALSSLALAISPWHIHYSRGGFDTNLFTFFLTLGTLFFLKAFEKPKYLFFSSIIFAVSFYSYQGARLTMPIFVIALAVIFFQRLLKIKKEMVIAALLGFVLILPALTTFLIGTGQVRFSGVSIFADPGPFWATNELRGQHANPAGLISEIFHNKLQAYGTFFFKNYFEHFSGNFLVISGDPISRNNIPETGVAYLFDIPFLLAGLYFLFKKLDKFWAVPVVWLLIAPIASAITFQSPQATRSEAMVVPLTMISAFGLYHFLKMILPHKKIFVLFLILITMFGIYNFSRYLHQYYVHNPKVQPVAFEFGFAQLVPKVNAVKDKYDKVLVTDRYDQPYILFLFYSKYSPEVFQKEAKLTPRDQFGFSTVANFDKFEFRKINWKEDQNLKNTLIVGTSEEIPENVKIQDLVLNPNGSVAFKIVGT